MTAYLRKASSHGGCYILEMDDKATKALREALEKLSVEALGEAMLVLQQLHELGPQ